MTDHLDENEIAAVVMSGLGISNDADQERLAYRAFGHVSQCEACRREAAELRAIFTGEPADPGADAEISLDGYRVVPFAPSSPAVPPVGPLIGLSLAAQTESVIERLPAFTASRVLRSEDGRVDLTVTEDLRDDTCRVYPKARGEIERAEVHLYLPPGVVCAWPARSYFEYPRFTFKAVDWTQTKLLYILPPDKSVEPPGSS